jgi:hypothetical protein
VSDRCGGAVADVAASSSESIVSDHAGNVGIEEDVRNSMGGVKAREK